MNQSDHLKISLEPHLLQVLDPLSTVLPDDLAAQLLVFLSPSSRTHIPYSTLCKISQWSRSPMGIEALKRSSLDPQSYSVVSLLAGTRTSPEKKFPAYVAKDPESERLRAADDRRAVSTVVNSVLSIAATGFATWWASAHLGLQLEWRALLATSIALVVALAEIILFMISDSRPSRFKTANRTIQRSEKQAEDMHRTLSLDHPHATL